MGRRDISGASCYRLPMTDCLTCEQLTAEFERLERRYAEAKGYLTNIAKTAVADRYNRARMQADEARLEYEVARIELERHQRTHTPEDE